MLDVVCGLINCLITIKLDSLLFLTNLEVEKLVKDMWKMSFSFKVDENSSQVFDPPCEQY